jgi:hypothetical protein
VWIVAANDDGHMMAVFTRGRLWGAVAKSNFVGLRYREPVYRSARELVMSYFNDYFNSLGERTMRGFTRPLDLSRFDGLAWTTEESGLEQLLDVELERVSVEPVLPRGAARWLTRVDARVEAAGLTGADPRGLFKPRP